MEEFTCKYEMNRAMFQSILQTSISLLILSSLMLWYKNGKNNNILNYGGLV